MPSRATPRFGTAVLARKRGAIRTLVAALAVPLPPIPALIAYLAVPGAVILDHSPPAEGIPVHFTAFTTGIIVEQLPERDRFALTRLSVFLRQLFFGEGLNRFDVLDGAYGQGIYVHAVQRVVAIDTVTVFVTRLVVSETGAASALAAGLTIAVYFFLHFFHLY